MEKKQKTFKLGQTVRDTVTDSIAVIDFIEPSGAIRVFLVEYGYTTRTADQLEPVTAGPINLIKPSHEDPTTTR